MQPAPTSPPAAAPPEDWGTLMARAQSGDAAAYRRLLREVTPWLRAVAGRAHRNPADAEDSVQDILLTLHEVRHTYQPARPFRPWLAGIARHRILDRLRVKGRQATREVALDLDRHDVAAPEADSPVLDAPALHAGLRALPGGQRQAVTLLGLQQMSLKQAAAASGQSSGALKVAMHRGLKTLRRLLGAAKGVGP